MKLKELKAVCAAAPASWDELDVDVWLPGTYIELAHVKNVPAERHLVKVTSRLNGQTRETLILEGNVRPGSAL